MRRQIEKYVVEISLVLLGALAATIEAIFAKRTDIAVIVVLVPCCSLAPWQPYGKRLRRRLEKLSSSRESSTPFQTRVGVRRPPPNLNSSGSSSPAGRMALDEFESGRR